MAELAQLKRERAGHRASLTKLTAKIDNYLVNDEIDIDELESLLEQLTIKNSVLVNLDSEILGITPERDIESEIETADEYTSKIIDRKIKLSKRMKGNPSESETSSSQSVQNQNLAESALSSKVSTIKLPCLEMTNFDGNILRFSEFWQQFEATIDKNQNLSDVEKLTYLRSYLRDSAELAVRGLALTGENYKTAVNILKDRFSRKDLVVDAHVSKLLNISPVRRSSDTSALRQFYSECETQLRSLENLGVDPDTHSCLLFPVLMKVLPPDLTIEFSRKYHGSNETKISDLFKFLKTELECRERAENLIGRQTHENEGRGGRSYSQVSIKAERRVPRSTKAVGTMNANVKPACIFCQEAHESTKCSTYSPRENMTKLKEQGRCFICFRKYHLSKDCKSKFSGCKLCKSKGHHEMVCFSNLNQKPENIEPDNSRKFPVRTEYQTSVSSVTQDRSVTFLQTCTAEAFSKDNSQPVRCLLDSAAMRSFVTRDVAEKLNLEPLRTESMAVYAFGSKEPTRQVFDVVSVQLREFKNPSHIVRIECLVTDDINGMEMPYPTKKINRLLTSKGLKLAEKSDIGGSQVDILIGADFYFSVNTGRVIKLNRDITAIETVFGYSIQGREGRNSRFRNPLAIKQKKEDGIVTFNICTREEEGNCTNRLLRSFWEIETLGIMDGREEKFEEKEMLKEFNDDIQLKGNRYEVSLPFKENSKVANNKEVAEHRLKSLVNRLKRDPQLYEEYKGIIESQLKEGIIERVEDIMTEDEDNSCYYMPHHPVIRNDKDTTKVRIVFDASSKGKGFTSLNENLSAGVNLNPDLLGLLLKFRSFKYGIVADIERAFLQIQIKQEYRDFQRFLWVDEIPPKKIKVYRNTRVTFGVTSSPYLLAATLKHHFEKYQNSHPETYKILKESFYVDDFISGANDLDEALRISDEAKTILKDASMNLRKWCSNSKNLKDLWKEKNFEMKDFEEKNSMMKVLGIIWDTEKDELRLELRAILDALKKKTDTKRDVLSVVAMLYDPMGIVSPFVVKMKILFQKLWERGMDWDEELPEDLRNEWEGWCEDIGNLQDLSISRGYLSSCISASLDCQLHIFCDASPAAYGAVAYFRCRSENGEIRTSFIMAKSRVAPLKKLTLPRLELMGALIAARIGRQLKEVFPNLRIVFWTDSTITLCWIRGRPAKWKQFVSNRVSEIQDLTDPHDWRHCDGKHNPADIISRGCSAKELKTNKIWFRGPMWLSLTEENWPKAKVHLQSKEKEDVAAEQRAEKPAIVSLVEADEQPFDVLSRFSSWNKLRRVLAWCLRFVTNCKRESTRKSGYLTGEEIKEAEIFILKTVQRESFQQELRDMNSRRPLKPKSKLISLHPFLDQDGLIRVGGRLKHALIPADQRHPFVLPKGHPVSELIIRHYHEKNLHAGNQLTLSAIRQRFWILSARGEVKRCIWKCITCCKLRAKPMDQLMGDLPAARVNASRAFSKVGVDFAGPFQIVARRGRGVRPFKGYICLFICFSVKAVHLELVSSLSSEAFLASFRRFCSRRGVPEEITSDCGTNFIGASRELRKLASLLQNDEGFHSHLSNEGIVWKFNPPSAPHFGGLWEAGVKSMKHHLRRVVGAQILSYEELLTLVSQVEACLNSRPLVPLSSHPEDTNSLTPGHFLIGKPLNAPPDRTEDQKLTLTNRWRMVQQFLNQIWKRWSKDYLCELQQRSKWSRERPNLRVNDLVVIKDDNMPPTKWRLGRVVRLFPGADGNVRVVEVRTATGELRRPVSKLCILPVND